MKKIVINKCFGGFSLSPIAQFRLAEKKELKLTFYSTSGVNNNRRIDGIPASNFHCMAYTKDLGDVLPTTVSHDCYFDDRASDRSDPDLVSVVEELGKEANGDCASLKIVSIPDDVEWMIEEYDGQEWVAEVHQTWA